MNPNKNSSNSKIEFQTHFIAFENKIFFKFWHILFLLNVPRFIKCQVRSLKTFPRIIFAYFLVTLFLLNSLFVFFFTLRRYILMKFICTGNLFAKSTKNTVKNNEFYSKRFAVLDTSIQLI